MDIRRIGPGDEAAVARAAHLFEYQPSPEWTALFLDDPGHHLLLAYVDDVPVGFIAGTEVYHLDRPPTMFLNGADVELHHRGKGIGPALVDALSALAAARGCTSSWVLAPKDDPEVSALFGGDGVVRDESIVRIRWEHAPAD